MKRSLVLLILFFQFAFLAEGQVMFQKLFVVQGGPIFGGSIIQCSDEGFAFAGFNANGLYNSYLIRTDKFGDTLWTNNSYGMPSSVTTTYDRGFVLSAIANGAYIIKTNFDGDTLWTREYQFSNNNVASILQSSDSGLIILTETWIGIGNKYSTLIKTDSLGNLIWSRSYQSSSNDMPYCVKQTFDGGFIISGNSDNGSIFLIKTNSIGDTIWTKEYDGFLGGFSVCLTNDSGYVICGSTISGASLIKTDSLGFVLWATVFPGNFVGQRKFALQTIDNGFLISGSYYGGGTNPDTAQLIKVDQTGNILWAKNYFNYLGAENWAAIQTFDGGYAFVGAASNGTLSGFYLVKTDSIGNSGCNDTIATVHDSSITVFSTNHAVSVSMININSSFGSYDIFHGCGVYDICSSVRLPEIENSGLAKDLFPNPADNFFNISTSEFPITSISVFNLLGKMEEYSQPTKNEKYATIDVSRLTPGIYFIKVETETGTSVQKLIKQ